MVATYRPLGYGAKQRTLAQLAGYYVLMAQATYFTAGTSGHIGGRWWGAGAEALGLAGTVLPDHFLNVLAGKDRSGKHTLVKPRPPKKPKKPGPPPPDEPNDGRPSGSKRRKPKPEPRDRAPGFDVTFSVPKTVSIMAAVGSPHVRGEIVRALEAAVDATLTEIQDKLNLARRGRGGRIKERGKLVVARFIHWVSRADDWEPNLHQHCVIANLVQRSDGSWASLANAVLRDHVRPTLGPLFHAHLAHELKTRLGIKLARPKDESGNEASWFEVAGIPQSLVKAWSSRRDEIESLIEGKGWKKLGDTSANARQAANLLTRKPKQDMPELDKLTEQWTREAAKHGITPERLERLCGRTKQAELNPKAYQAAWRSAIKDATTHEAYFNESAILERVLGSLPPGMDSSSVWQRVRHDLAQSPDIVRLGQEKGEKQYTTTEMWKLEGELKATVKELQQRSGAIVSDKTKAAVLREHPELSPEQLKAYDHLLSQKQAVRITTGVAGAGKSTLLKAVGKALVREGYDVRGTAIAGIATEQLAAKTQIESRTVASYIYHLDKPISQRLKDRLRHDIRQLIRAALGKRTYAPNKIKFNKRTVLIVDESGMLPTVEMYRLAHHINKAGGTIFFVGDVEQIQPVLSGGPLPHICKQMQKAHLQENRRQQDAADRQAVTDIREGRAAEALKSYAERGRITIGKDRKETIQKLVDVWAEQGGANRPNEHAIYTQTRRQMAVVNELCQKRRQRERQVSSLGVSVGDQRICTGDRIMFRTADRQLGFENGTQGTVTNVDRIRRRITVKLDQAPAAKPWNPFPRRTVTVPLRKLGNDGITLSYAMTTHRAQGQTVEHGYMLLGTKMTDKQLSYVQATRARQSTRLFCDEVSAGPGLAGLVKDMERSRIKRMAHDIQAKLQRHVHDTPRLTIQREL